MELLSEVPVLATSVKVVSKDEKIKLMTTLIMPSDYGMEMLVGSSPVLGSGFLGGSPAYFSDYNRCAPMWNAHNPSVSCLAQQTQATTINAKASLTHTNAFVTGFSELPDGVLFDGPSFPATLLGETFSRLGSLRRSTRDSIRRRKVATVDAPPLKCLKPCLISRAEEETPEGATSPSREKKKVSFADMEGGNLTYIKFITERPDCPPRWSQDFLDQVTGGAKAEAVPDQWALAFSQPAADYLTFKARLERNNIALENVLLKEGESILAGTVKVRNMAFDKEVTIRYTNNNWLTYEDVEGTYISTPSSGSSYNIYDTFGFEMPLPCSTQSDKIEFCLSYHTGGQSFWDNNNDKNYVVVAFRSQKSTGKDERKPLDAYDVRMDSWSEFSAWNNLEESDSPYY